MKMRIKLIFSIATFALMAACNGAADNKPAANANASNANTAPKVAAPTKEALMEIENQAWKDWAERNEKGLEGYMASNFVNVGYNGASDRAAALKSWTSHKCEMGDMAFSDEAVTELGDGIALLTFKATGPITCDKIVGPSPLNVSVLYGREDDAWKAIYYQEVPAADAKGDYGPPSATYDKAAELASLKAAPEAIAAVEKKLWDTWKSQDRKAFEESISDKFFGNGRAGALDREAYLKGAFDPPCKVESVSTGPMKAMEISKDLTMLIYRASQKGTCGTDKLPENVMSVSMYKNENGKPMAIYYMENPVRN
ncbi:MAG TPA: nuclear transport factor 2 family protein [Pyrinomonadaceae bacterium]|nr:nuclear transport factor 2 family protein [Pyrinomonadaceae bacterium]HMP66798.1 nuclear transport factor 2 family protein [Pyrinomonadaceae bacterium]